MSVYKAQRLVITGFILSALIFLGNSGGPLDGLTGAPGDFDCTFCHPPGGSTQTGNLQIIGFPTLITPLATYPVEFRINKTTGIARTAGFELVVIEGNTSSSGSVGSWTSTDPFVTISTSGNRTYVKHGPQEYQYNETFNGPETVVYDAEWTAPAIVNDNIWVYGIANIGGFPEGTDGDLIVTSVLSDLALPVELEVFEVKRGPDGLPVLNWATSSEANSSHFIVMRSSNGRTFDELGQREAMGFTAHRQEYTFIDWDPLPGGVSFYKLQMVDLDGKFHYSGIRTLNADPATALKMTVFPNPLPHGECIFVEIATPRALEDVVLSVWHSSGARALDAFVAQSEKSAGMHRIAIDPRGLPPGVYYVTMQANREPTTVRKLIISE